MSLLDLNSTKEYFRRHSEQKQPFSGVLQSRCSYKFRNIHRKTSVLEPLFNKNRSFFQACNFIKKSSTQVFSCEYCEILRIAFYIEHLWWLLLSKNLTAVHFGFSDFHARQPRWKNSCQSFRFFKFCARLPCMHTGRIKYLSPCKIFVKESMTRPSSLRKPSFAVLLELLSLQLYLFFIHKIMKFCY